MYKKRLRSNEEFISPAEFQILKLMILNNKPFEQVTEHHFPHRKAKVIYHAMAKLFETSETVTRDSLLREANQLSDDITQQIVEFVFAFETDMSSLDGAIEALADSVVKSKMTRFIDKISSEVKSSAKLNLSQISQDILNAQDVIIGSGKKNISKTVEQCLDEYKEELDLRRLGHYYSFGDEFLDTHLTRKAAPGQVVLLASSSGTGKSAYGLNLINGMINMDRPVMYFSLEMDTISTMDRLMSMRSGIPVSEWYRSGVEIDPLYKVLEDQRASMLNKPFRFIDDPSINLLKMQGLIREFKSIYKTDYVCVFVDLITQVKEFIDLTRGSLANTIEASVNRLNRLAKKENVCFVAIAQMNRGADSDSIDNLQELDKLRPTFNNVKNSSALGERARVTLGAFRPKYYAERLFPDSDEAHLMPDVLEIQILKQNQGTAGNIGRYLFEGETFNISPLVETPPEEAAQNLQY
jgi:replicative DNA helicase